jgi:hypothetical protein
MAPDRFHGIYPILYAFFDAEGALARDGIVAQVEAAVRHGAHGVAVLGIATETNKLDAGERRTVMEWTAQALRKRLPLAVTIAEPSVHGQVAFARAAHEAGADFVILQPPPVSGLAESEYLRFFGAVADAAPLPVAIQNAAQFLGIGLSNAGLASLHRNSPEREPPQGRGARARDRAADRRHGRRVPRVQRPRRARAARLPARGLRRDDPGARVLRRAGRVLRGDARGARGRGGVALTAKCCRSSRS